MSKRFRPGQWPSHPRLFDIDLEVILEDVRNLFAYARDGESGPFDSHRAIVAIEVAAAAARGRERGARGQPIPPYELAALVGVHRSRIYQMIRNQKLRTVPGGVSAESARNLLDQPNLTAPPTAHRIVISPSYARSNLARWGTVQVFMDKILGRFPLPRGTRYVVDAYALEVRIPATARMTDAAAEVLRSQIAAHLETVETLDLLAANERGEVARA